MTQPSNFSNISNTSNTNTNTNPNLNEIGHYVVTSQPSGSVLTAVRCSFFSSNSTDVAIAKSNRLELRQFQPPHLPLLLTLPIHGRISFLLPIRLPLLPVDCLFFTTERGDFALLSHDDASTSHPVRTHASGTFADSVSPTACPQLAHHPNCLAIHYQDGWINILPIRTGYDGSTRGPFGEPFQVRIDERTLMAMSFLDGSGYFPQLAMLCMDCRGGCRVVSYGVDLVKKCLVEEGKGVPAEGARLRKSRVDGGSVGIISVPVSKGSALGGVLILGSREITYHHTGEGITRILPVGGFKSLVCFCGVQEKESEELVAYKYLIGDLDGRIHLLTLLRNIESDGSGDGVVTKLLMETLGTASSPSALVYLGQGSVFVGSQFGDSQLIQILESPVPVVRGGDGAEGEDHDILEETTYLQVVEEYINLGPIVDFDLRPCGNDPVTSSGDKNAGINKPKHGQSIVATCSGVGKDGSVRLVRNGIGMREHAEVEIPGIKGMWSLRQSYNDDDDVFLVQSFVIETRILGVHSEDAEMNDAEEEGGASLAEVTIPGFDSSKSTLFAGNLMLGTFDLFVQVVQDGIRLVNSDTLELVLEWSTASVSGDEGESVGIITVASANESGQILVALNGGILIYLVVEGEFAPSIRCVGRTKLDHEISCIDLNPLDASKDSDDSMVLDCGLVPSKSRLAAVGLWDDFSVRLLHLGGIVQPDGSHDGIYSALDQVLRIDLRAGSDFSVYKSDVNENDEGVDGCDSGQNMLARSLSLVSLYPQSSGNNARIVEEEGVPKKSNIKVDMLLVGLGDGKLISFVIDQTMPSNMWSVHSRKEVSLGTQGIHLIRIQNRAKPDSGTHGTCVLATGDRPTVVYLTGGSVHGISNPKLTYSTLSLTVEDDEGGQPSHANISVNAAASFRSSLLFSSACVNNYSLCVSDENKLRLGVIDDIQKLHVSTYKLGMTPRRINYHDEGRVYCIGCIDGGIDDDINMRNFIRFFDDSSFEEIHRIDLEPFETLLSLVSVPLCIGSQSTSQNQFDGADCRPYILIGTAYAYPDEDEPNQGRVLVVECTMGHSSLKPEEGGVDASSRYIRQITQMPTRGGVYSMCPFYNGTFILTVNSKTHLCQLSSVNDNTAELELVGAGHHGHMLSLFVSSLAHRGGDAVTSGTGHPTKQLAIVGDLMRSISLVEYMPKHNVMEELARDYNGRYCTAIAMLTSGVYMGSEGHNNLFVLRHNANASSEEARVRLDTLGEYHLGEIPNKFMGGSLIMPIHQGRTLRESGESLVPVGTTNSPASNSHVRPQRFEVRVGSQTLFATVDGTIGSVLGLDGGTFAFLSTLQRAMIHVIKSVGDLSHEEYRAFRADRQVRPSRGFIDGDFVESFLDLNRPTMEKVVKYMNDDGRWRIRDNGLGFSQQNENEEFMETETDYEVPSTSDRLDLDVESVLSVVEEISMMH